MFTNKVACRCITSGYTLNTVEGLTGKDKKRLRGKCGHLSNKSMIIGRTAATIRVIDKRKSHTVCFGLFDDIDLYRLNV